MNNEKQNATLVVTVDGKSASLWSFWDSKYRVLLWEPCKRITRTFDDDDGIGVLSNPDSPAKFSQVS